MDGKLTKERVRAIEDCLLRAISGDLTARAEVSDALDEVDGIATGVNILIGELEYRLQELRDATIRAEASVMAKRRFLRNMSHEIRTPMNGVMGILSLLEATELSFEQQECTGTIKRSGLALMRLMDDILDFSKIESNVLRLELSENCLYDVCDDVIVLLGESAASRGLSLSWYFEPGIDSRHRMDGGRVRQILVNLLSNAIKFTPSGGVALHVGLGQVTESEQEVLIEVYDTGIGVASESHQELFAPFYQTDNTNSREYGGSGLGLAITKELVELMGGSVGLESELGQGSRFWCRFRLPRVEGYKSAGPAIRDVTTRGVVSVVSEVPVFSRSIERQFSAWGYDTVPYEGLESHGEPSVDILVWHCSKPGILKWLQSSRDSAAKLPSIIVTEKAKRVELLDYLGDATSICFVSSPLRPRELRSAADPASARNSGKDAGNASSLGSSFEPSREVLLVEDNPDNQFVMTRILKALGMDVVLAQNGVEAVEMWAEGKWGVVFMDCQMPKMDGFEAATRLRSMSGGDDVVIIGVTAGASQEDHSRARSCGMDECITKPVSISAVRAVVARVLT